MGLSDEELVDAFSIPAALRCVICAEVFVDPVCGVTCQHVFCSSCIHRALDCNSHCPLCRVLVDRVQLRRNHLIQALLDDLRVRCHHAAHGCGWTGRLVDRATHQVVCPVQENQRLRSQLKAAMVRTRVLERELETLQRQGAQKQQRIDSLQKSLVDAHEQLREVSSGRTNMIQVFVKDPAEGIHALYFCLDEDMSKRISEHLGISQRGFYLTGMGRTLRDGATARQYNIVEGCTVLMNARPFL